MSTVTRARTVRHRLALAARRRHTRLVAFAAVVGPGVLAGLSDDDPAGITTYSILGADFGYRLLWVLLLSTVALIVFHELGARMGCVTGRGLAGLIRDRYGRDKYTIAGKETSCSSARTWVAKFTHQQGIGQIKGPPGFTCRSFSTAASGDKLLHPVLACTHPTTSPSSNGRRSTNEQACAHTLDP